MKTSKKFEKKNSKLNVISIYHTVFDHHFDNVYFNNPNNIVKNNKYNNFIENKFLIAG
ncbi:hypothetical protein [Anaeromicropila herbilytica]|uniref:Uncharacterized protein n=1 Tax=Anaeromicropila herbilytica TaxID=2785025 RepID=A0A7R7EMU6_9FIRM|nr:hypothetical protein [Anaeromicropila herbilytica]BCN31766.1 hypothetical protein bsdtb5_30610 [Anaeromicropila herbilytica]